MHGHTIVKLSAVCKASNDARRNSKRLEGSSHDQLEVLSCRLSTESEENTKTKQQQDPLCRSGSSNPMPSECCYEALPLELFCSMTLVLIA